MTEAVLKIEAAKVAKEIAATLTSGLTEAAKLYREFIDAGGTLSELQKTRTLSKAAWAIIDGVAYDRIDARLLSYPQHITRFLHSWPIETQRDVIDNGLEMLTEDGSALLFTWTT